jgi:hypothetical protein
LWNACLASVKISLWVFISSNAVKSVVTTPDTCRKWSPIRYPPIARAIEKVKFTYSSPFHLFNTLPPTYPIALPRASAPNIVHRNESEVFINENATLEKIIPFMTPKETKPVASF